MKKDNKGFSLVELIVVIAIMAVLMVVLTPALLRYVEKGRLQTDNTAIAEIANAAKIACASEAVNTEVSGVAPVTITIPITTAAALTTDKTTPKFDAEMALTIGNVALKSNTYKNATTKPTLTVSVDATTQAVTVTGNNLVEDGVDVPSKTY